MIANWTLSIISCYLACFAHRFSSYVAFFSRTSAGSLPRARARVLAGLMPQGSVLPLDLIGSEGARLSQKSCNFGRISVFGLPNRPHAGDVGGVSRAQRLCGRLWAAFAHFVSILFACRICGRSCPHPIAAPAALRYHDRNCFKRALKCILRSKQAGKGTQHNKEG